MATAHRFVLLTIAAAACAGFCQAARPGSPSYSRDVAPFLRHNCAPCHYGAQRAGGLKMDSVAALLKGGGHGPAIVAGKAYESRLVLMMEGKVTPQMPPIPNAKPLDTRRLRAWIEGGAKDDSPATPPSSGQGTGSNFITQLASSQRNAIIPAALTPVPRQGHGAGDRRI